LPSGAYRFEVRARDADGVLSAPATLAFVVLAPWWLTPWAWLGYSTAGGALIFAFVRLRTRALRQRAEQLEAVVAQRTRELAHTTTELAAQNTELLRLNQLELDEKITARLAEEKARLEVLRYQLNPHFLFNTLASISAALPAGASTPRTMVERLAEFCRLTLHRPDGRDWTTLGEEMQLLRSYLEIERSRWGALLDVEIACDPALDGERLPHFLLLPLVENALKYGRATSPDRVGLRLTASRGDDGALVFTVSNTGEWIEPSAKKTVSTLGIGLENLRERLARHYPRAHRLEFSHTDGWVTVVLRIFSPPVSS
jgi:LytS/YehU family sensor histidine kinase